MSTPGPRVGQPQAGARSTGLRALVGDVVRSSRGHDLPLYAAGVTFYGAIGAVPLLLVGLWLAGLLAGEGTVRALAGELAALIPPDLGADDAATRLAASGTTLGWTGALLALVPASLYGEGLVRAFDRLSDEGEPGRRSLRGRAGSLLIVAVSPLLLLLGLSATRGLVRGLGDGPEASLLGVYCAFLVGWGSLTVLLVLCYRGIAPGACRPRALLWGAASTGSFLSGTCLGFVLFLGLGIDLGGAYGSSTLAALAVTLGWAYLLHLVVLVGYVLTLRLEARQGRPLAAPTGPDLVRAA